jgi:hypothetical protein
MILTEDSVQGAHNGWIAYFKKGWLEMVSVILDQCLSTGITDIKHLLRIWA